MNNENPILDFKLNYTYKPKYKNLLKIKGAKTAPFYINKGVYK